MSKARPVEIRTLPQSPQHFTLVVVAVIPVVLGLPPMLLPVPPLVIGAPAPFPLAVQIAPPVFRLTAVLAIVVDRLVQPRLRFLNCMLAVGAVVGMRSRRSGEK